MCASSLSLNILICIFTTTTITTTTSKIGDYDIELEFLGKDSMLYKQTTNFDNYGETGRAIYDNFVFFCDKKKKSEQILDLLDPPSLNKHLSSLMPGLTAKVFRTYNASETLQNELPDGEALARCENIAQKVQTCICVKKIIVIIISIHKL
jgi:DNA topoisomerase I